MIYQKILIAWKAGKEAYKNGLSINDCPYSYSKQKISKYQCWKKAFRKSEKQNKTVKLSW